MSTDLEDLVRDTLAGRAATVTNGPEWAPSPGRRSVNRWLVAAAAAAVVVTAGTVAAVTQAAGRHHDDAAGGSARSTCTTSLPSAWRQALGGPRFTVGGLNAWPDAVAKDGTTVTRSVDPSGTKYRTSLVAEAGPATPLLSVPRGRLSSPWGTDTDGRYAVFNFAPDERPGGSVEPPIDDIVLVDPRTHARTHLLEHAPAAKGFKVAWRGAVIQSGIVYWGMDAPGDAPARGIVLAYDVGAQRYRVLARLHESAAVLRDPRGVHWADGLVPAGGVPRSVPVAPASLQWRQNVVSDGRSFAWPGPSNAPDSQVVYWVRGHDEHHWRVHPANRPSGGFMVSAVAGPFVFGRFSTGPVLVVDVRSGAVAALDKTLDLGPTVAGRFVFFPRYPNAGTTATVRVEIATLPELHC